jgi:hypothetical protein
MGGALFMSWRGWGREENQKGKEIHNSRFAEVSNQRFDISTKRYLLDK